MNADQKVTKNIIFFDGICTLCNSFVNILMKIDYRRILFFTPLQGETAKKHNLDFKNLPPQKQSLYYLNSKGILYSKSNAVIHILCDLFFLGQLFWLLKLIPQFIRDYLYSVLARNRYALFGKKDHCRVPTPKEKSRFLEDSRSGIYEYNYYIKK